MVTSVLFSPLVAQKCHPSVKFAWLPFVAAWFFTLLGSMASAQSIIDLGTITTVLDAATLERSFSSQDIAASNAATLTDFLADNNCLVLHTGGTGSTANVSIGGYAGACIKVYVDGVLANDPRPHYQNDPERVYGLRFAGYNVRFSVKEKHLTVLSVEEEPGN